MYRRFRRVVLATLAAVFIIVLPSASADGRHGQTTSLSALAWNSSTTRFAGGDEAGNVKIWDTSTNQVVFALTGHTAQVNWLAWSPDGTRLASASNDKTVRIWNTTTGQVTHTLQGHASEVVTLAWSPDGSKLASSSATDEPMALRIWNTTTGQLVSSHRISEPAAMAWSPDGSKLAGALPSGVLNVINTATFEDGFALTLSSGGQRGMFSVAWSPNSQKIASGSSDGSVVIWDVATKQKLYDLRGNDVQPISFNESIILSLAFSSDGSKLASVSRNGAIRTWNTSSGQVLSTDQVTGPLKAAALSQSGSKVVYSGSGGTPQTTDVPTLSSTLKLQYYPDPNEAGTISEAIGPDFNIVQSGRPQAN